MNDFLICLFCHKSTSLNYDYITDLYYCNTCDVEFGDNYIFVILNSKSTHSIWVDCIHNDVTIYKGNDYVCHVKSLFWIFPTNATQVINSILKTKSFI